ncbi:MAG: hypothetical protein IT204_19085 [Fimbriimonadaceae bacterium]|nr:hypothetical protein [Fimbriimonadaceae bacterium]
MWTLLLLPWAAPDLPVPPPLPRRAISPPAEPPPGTTLELRDGEVKATLYLPPNGDLASQQLSLQVHFHTVAWFTIAEHRRRGSRWPLLNLALGEGSNAYRLPFEDRERFGRLLRQVEDRLREHGAPAEAVIQHVRISSFSAGYGAVREILKIPQYCQLIRRVVLCDSLYAGFEPGPADQPRQAARENMAPWDELLQAAVAGRQTFCLSFSQVPTGTYANTALCAEALARSAGATWQPVAPGSLPAAADPAFPLLRRVDRGRLHLWGYAGEDAAAHLTHVRHLADLEAALDAVGAP